MPIINNPFNGKLNLDVAQYRISNGDYIDALNITKDSEGVGNDLVVANILGNTNIPYTLPAGENKVIGFYPDKVRDRAYYFLWNSNGYNSILYYNASTQTIVKVLESKTDSDGIDILSFNPSYKVLSVNIYYRDVEGDIIFFNDGLNPPRNINILANYGTSWKAEYLLVIKAPPVMPPKVTYENDANITINNLRNKLFQFSYRYVYDNNEKSVWSSKSIVPLPQQPSLELTDNTATNNARIAVLFSTGGPDVRAIELCFRETTNGLTSDWFLIESFNKASLNILDNDIFITKFFNDSIYIQLDIIETTQLQDWVPQIANASELANGNVLLYAGIVEGYDKTNMDLSVDTATDAYAYFYEQAGLLFLATVNGTDSGSGTQMTIYLYGTGTNTSGEVTTLNNSAGTYYINSFSASGTDLSTFYTANSSNSNSVNSILSGISYAMFLEGYTQVSLIGNKLVMNYANGFVLTSVGFKTFTLLSNDNTRFAYVWDSGYQYAIQYFDAQGRTIGAQTDIDATINTPSFTNLPDDEPIVNYPQISLNIFNQPPLYATYYQILRSNNTTYNKRLCWISESAFAGITSGVNNTRFIYIGIGNIAAYNEAISSTQNVVSYNYTEGDRIRFIAKYNVSNEINYLTNPPQYDYEIVGTVASFEYNISNPVPLAPDNNTYTATGNFLKIRYPNDDIGVNFDFPGTEDFQHYQILLYNYSTNTDSSQRFFYEFGKEYGIGNPGTAQRYHFGLQQTQSSSNPAGVPAIIPITNGDLFYRLRTVPFSDKYNYSSSLFDIGTSGSLGSTSETFPITVDNTIDNLSYRIQTQPNAVATLSGASFPVWASTGYFFYNKSSSIEKIVSVNGSFNMLSDGTSTFSVYAVICTNLIPYAAKYTVSLLPIEVNDIVQNTNTTFTINKRFSVPPTGKVWIVATSTNDTIGSNNIVIQPMSFEFQIIKDVTIGIIESSFNDTYNLITNSNGRPSVIDENAAKRYFPTLIRFGQAYQFNTNINGTNRFFYENFDEYDRSFGDVIRLHVRDRYLKVYQKFKVGNVPILTQIVKDSANNPLQANTDVLINKIQYYAGDYGIGDAATSLAWNNFADYFVDNYRGVVCRLSQDGITPISIINKMNAFFVATLSAYRQELNNGIVETGVYMGNPCIYGVFDAYTNKYIIAMEEINRYVTSTTTTTTAAPTTTTTAGPTTTTTTTSGSTTTTTTTSGTTTTTTTLTYCQSIGAGAGCFNWDFTAGATGAIVQWTDCNGNNQTSVLNEGESGNACLCDGATPNVLEGSLATISQVGQCVNISTTTTTLPPTTTTTTLPPFQGLVCLSSAGGGQEEACYDCPQSFIMTGNQSTFCDSTVFTADEWFYTVTTGDYWLSYNGFVVRVTHTSGQDFATKISAGCQTCPPNISTTTTTAAPIYSYYIATRCDDPLSQQYFQTTSIYSPGTSLKYNNFCWEVVQLQGTSGVVADDIFIDCAVCNATLPTTTTTTTTAAPTTTTTTTAAPTTTTTAAPVFSYYVATRCDNPSLQQYFQTTGSFAIGESVRYNNFCWEIQALTGASGVNYISAHIDCAACYASYPTTTTAAPTTTTTTCNPTPNWVNNGAAFCSSCISYQPQIDTNPCSPTYNTTRNLSLGTGAPCNYTANWVNNGAAFCSACVSYQPQIDNNPCSATYNTTRNLSLGASAPCNYTANFVNTGTTCVGVDLYNVQTDNNPCSPTYNQTQLGSLIQANSPSCGYTTTTTTAAPVFSYYVATRCDNPSLQQYFQTTGSFAIGEAVRYNGYCWEIQALTGTSGVTPDFNYINCSACYVANPTTTTTTTTASPSCTCFTIVNEGGATGNYTYVDCSTGQTLSVNISAGDTQNRCVVLGNTPTQNSGLLTIIDCTTPCSIEGNCTGC
jgi:hypothetical protein